MHIDWWINWGREPRSVVEYLEFRFCLGARVEGGGLVVTAPLYIEVWDTDVRVYSLLRNNIRNVGISFVLTRKGVQF